MHFVYILKGANDRYYIGSTSDLEKRVKKHNAGGSIWTKKFRPWQLLYREEFESKSAAIKREKQIKSYKSGNEFRKLVEK